MSKQLFVNNIVEPQDAPDVGVTVSTEPAREVMLAPQGDAEWGFFMFPTVWRLRNGLLVCAVTVGNDEMPSHADYHYLWYVSEDEGEHWTAIVPDLREAESLVRERQTLPNGRQIYYEPAILSLDAVDVEPFDFVPEETLKGCRLFYRLGDLPEEQRYVRMFSREPGDSAWHEGRVTMDPDIIVPAFMEPVIEGDPDLEPTHSAMATRLRKLFRYIGDDRLPSLGKEEPRTDLGRSFKHKHNNRIGMNIHVASTGIGPEDIRSESPANIVTRLLLPSPTSARFHDQTYRPIMAMQDGRLFATSFGYHPAQALRVIKKDEGLDTGYCPNIFKSCDAGWSWQHYSSIPYDLGCHKIHQAHITPDMPQGNWMAMCRSKPLMLTRSYDDGRTWEMPEAIRPTSINPAGGLLPNGVAFRMHGRPGQHITFCCDGEGKEWGNDITLVEGTGDPSIEQNRNTCANSCTYVTGPDSFVVVYTDYSHRYRGGHRRPAVLARRVTARN